MGSFLPIILLVVMFGIMYLLIIRPQKKRDKATAEMRNAIQVGDEVVTIGGIIGRVVAIREDNLLIETGSDRSKVRIKRWSIQNNETNSDTKREDESK